VFQVPICIPDNLPESLITLRRRYNLTLVAAELSPEAVTLDNAPRPQRVALLFGAEGEGLSSPILAVCDQRVVIPMAPESDSLNVAVASGIFLQAFRPAGTAECAEKERPCEV
jgi:tRNA G18 (ribose-2'-O)-methylase SpoU